MSNKPFNLNESVINSVRTVLVSSQEQEINSLVEQATSLFFAHNKDTSKTLPVFVKEYVMKKTMNPTLATICETVAKDNEKNLTETVEGKGPQMLNEAAGSMPRSAREKKLAAMAHPKDKITHKDVLVGRGVVAKEEVEQIDELKSSTLAGYIVKASKSAIGTAAAGDTRTTKNRKFGIERAVSKMYKRVPDAPKDPWEDPKFYNAQFKNRQESTDTPGNSYKHQCAIHVKHEQFGEGRTIFSQHAAPDQDGNIAWYDVMFEHGIEKQVSINEIQVLHSESHMMHKKKKMKSEDVQLVDEMKADPETLRADRGTEVRTTPSGRKIVVKKPKSELKVEDVEYVDEAKRGRPRKNPLPAGQAPEEGDKEHFIMQLRKSVSMRGKKDVEFDNGEKMKVPAHVASAVLDHYNSLKTAEQKDRLHKSVSKSPKHIMSHYEMYHGN